jgi:hypothetical protein
MEAAAAPEMMGEEMQPAAEMMMEEDKKPLLAMPAIPGANMFDNDVGSD